MRQSLILMVAATLGASAQTMERDGWKISADASRALVAIEYGKLGPILEDGTLHFGGRALRNWTAVVRDGALQIRLAEIPGSWTFRVEGSTLTISATSADAVLTARAPAPATRIVARLIDPQGVPVTWKGTDEVKGSYGGKETVNPSFLPRRNPDVMYFALGPAQGGGFHSLFDRPTDTAIDFPETARMSRPASAGALDIRIPVPGNALVRALPDYYTRTLGLPRYVPFDDSRFKTAPLVWCSWTSYYSEVTEKDIVENADWLSRNLLPYGFDYVQLDDGYDVPRGEGHHWIGNWDREKFPHGPEWLTRHIKSIGLHPGLWLVPNAYAGAAGEHPDWYLKNREGGFVLDYRTPALDSTNPNAQAFLKRLFTTLKAWGFEYYKFDGEHPLPQYAPVVDRSKLYDPNIDPLEAYQQRLKLIRDVIGPETFVEGCPAGTPLNGIGTFNSCFTGHDLYPNWQGMYPLFSSIGANAFLNHIVLYVMPGEGIEVAPWMSPEQAASKRVPSVLNTMKTREEPLTGVGVSLAEARTVVSHVALTGVVYPLASVMKELPEERARLLKMTMPTLPVMPVDLFSRGTDIRWNTFRETTADQYIHNYPEILDLKVNGQSGAYDVVALTNWRSRPTARALAFAEKLGLDEKASYAVFDFWAQKLLGVYRGRLAVDIAPHDTRVILVHPVSGHPQVVGLSRHISGAFSVAGLAWDNASRTLRGTAEAVEGDPYTIWVYLPAGFRTARVRAAAGGQSVPVEQQVAGNSLMLRFAGGKAPVEWAAEFTTDK